jgi:hypothetical protein
MLNWPVLRAIKRPRPSNSRGSFTTCGSSPKISPDGFALQVLENQAPRRGKVRLTIDWTTEDDQHLPVISLVVGRRALPIFWRAYSQGALKRRMKRYELAVIKSAFKLIFLYVKPGRIRLSGTKNIFAQIGKNALPDQQFRMSFSPV